MKLQDSVIDGLLGLGMTKLVRLWMSTLDSRAVFQVPDVDPVQGVGGPRIYIFWHEYILLPLYLRGHCRIAMLLSQHRDADILASVARLSGFACVRGSTSRGGAKALRQLAARSKQHHLAITPDGPRGPRRRLEQGAIYLASRLGLPLVPFGIGYDKPFRAPTWDDFAVPKPFTRARAVVGAPMMIEPHLGRDGIEAQRRRVEQVLTDLTSAAEDWAASGERRNGEVVCRPQAARSVSPISEGPIPEKSTPEALAITMPQDRQPVEPTANRRAA